MPEAGEEPRNEEPQTARSIALQVSSDGPLKDLNGRTLPLRRYASEWLDTEAYATDRIDAQLCHLKMMTEPAEDGYPAGPEFTLIFRVGKPFWRKWLSALLVIAAAVLATVGTAVLKDHLATGIGLIAFGAFLGGIGFYLWSGRVKLPLK
jgi:hypothetical protein